MHAPSGHNPPWSPVSICRSLAESMLFAQPFEPMSSASKWQLSGMRRAGFLFLACTMHFFQPSVALKSVCLVPSATAFTLTDEYSCLPGLYCPFLKLGDNTTLPAMCPPTISCSIKRLTGGWCSPPQGTNEPRICPKGFYCSSPTTSQTCPAGSWCPTGSSRPIECEWFSSCPAGSFFRTHWGLLLLCAIADVLVISMSLWNFRVLSKLKESSWMQLSGAPAPNEDICCPLLAPSASSSTAPPQSQGNPAAAPALGGLLASGFSKMNRTGSIELKVLDVTVNLPDVSSYSSYCLSNAVSCARSADTVAAGNAPPLRKIISHVSAVFTPGRVHAIMGPSGSGKTTLLHCIAGKLQATSGSILLNSTPVNPRAVKKCVGFVPQDDVMLRTLTVQEIVEHRCVDASVHLPVSHFFPARACAWAPLSQKVKSWLMPVRSSLRLGCIRCAIQSWATKCRVAFRAGSGSDLT
jgi:hypothetical protein